MVEDAVEVFNKPKKKSTLTRPKLKTLDIFFAELSGNHDSAKATKSAVPDIQTFWRSSKENLKPFCSVFVYIMNVRAFLLTRKCFGRPETTVSQNPRLVLRLETTRTTQKPFPCK